MFSVYKYCLSACTEVGQVIPQGHLATGPVPDWAHTVVELPSSDEQWGKSQAPGYTSACPAHLHLYGPVRFNILMNWAGNVHWWPQALLLSLSALPGWKGWDSGSCPDNKWWFLPVGTSVFAVSFWGQVWMQPFQTVGPHPSACSFQAMSIWWFIPKSKTLIFITFFTFSTSLWDMDLDSSCHLSMA